jgi:hypothetical protein
MPGQFCRNNVASRHEVIWLHILRPSHLKSAGTVSLAGEMMAGGAGKIESYLAARLLYWL